MSAQVPKTSRSGQAIAAVCATALAAIAFPPARVHAQVPDTLLLTLERALEIAEARNPSYRRAFNDVQLNGTETRTTWLDQILPRASVDLFRTGFTGNLTHRATDNFGNPIERPDSDWVYFSSTRQSLGLQWNVQGASIFQSLRRQRLVNETRDVQAEGALSGIQVAVRRQYMDVLEQRDLLAAEDALVEARRKDRDVVDRLFSLGVKNKVDVLNADLGIEQQALQAQRQRTAFRRSELALRTRLGDDELPPFALADEPLPLFDPASLEAEALVRTALDVNPDLRRQRYEVESANLGLAESRRSWWPVLSMNLSVARNAQTRDQTQTTAALFDVSFDEDLDSQFSIGLSIPMFSNYFSNQERIHQAEVSLDNQREAERETRLGVEQNVRGALLELQNQYENLRLAERSSSIAGEALRLTQEEYRIGSRSFEELRQSIEQEASTRRQVIQARHGFVDALLSLEEAVGTTVTPFAGG